MSRIYNMPPQYGKVAKVFIKNRTITKNGNHPLNINIYTLGQDNNGKLCQLNSITKQNVAKYLQQYRILTDSIDLLNAYIINIQIKFDLVTTNGYNSQQVLLNCMLAIKQFFKIQA